MTDQVLPDKETGGETPPSQRRSTEGEVAQAIDLGWRVAALHALTPTTIEPIAPVSPDMLLNRRSLSAADRLELEVRAIAGVAERAAAPIAGSRLEKLLRLTLGAGESPEGEAEFRDEVARLHVVFSKELWAAQRRQRQGLRARQLPLGQLEPDRVAEGPPRRSARRARRRSSRPCAWSG